ncbi:MAG TPA: hypothetical protein VGG71_12885 [Chitinophagaceae bacterium]|jgi:hypothetical protein
MELSERMLSPEESLKIIADAISSTKENIRENSFCFLLWGWLLALASFLFYIIHKYTGFQYYFVVFPAFALIGIVVTLYWYAQRKKSNTISYLSYFLSRLWLVLGICFITVVFINVYQGNLPFTYTLLIAGVGTTVTGLVLKFMPLVAGGVLLLISATASIFVPDDYKVILHGVSIILGYLVPGYLLRNHKA